jgi:magnesium-transporting ATPase (P-type)
MKDPPRHPDSPILSGVVIGRIALVSVLLLMAVFSVFAWQKAGGYPLEVARTVAVNIFVMASLAYLFNSRSLTKSMFRLGVFSNPWLLLGCGLMIALQLLFTYAPFMNRLFSSAPISGKDWIIVIGVSLALYSVIGTEKWLRQRVFIREEK